MSTIFQMIVMFILWLSSDKWRIYKSKGDNDYGSNKSGNQRGSD